MTRRPYSAIPSGRAAVLAAVLWLERPTVRAVAELAGLTVSTTHAHLVKLRDEGLVTWEKGKAATLRPTLGMSWPSAGTATTAS